MSRRFFLRPSALRFSLRHLRRLLSSWGLTLGALISSLSLSACKTPTGVAWVSSGGAPLLHVNQVGYFPQGAKRATLRSESTKPVSVELLAEGRVVWSGLSQARGYDEASGDSVHEIDFSEFTESGDNYRLRAAGSESFPFAIRENLYEKLPVESLKYFYHNRSGVAISRPYIDDDLWSRPAGHLSDASVPCWRQNQCSYELDVSGGWYDAGDHGKYVVNGGISAWTLLALAERYQHLGPGLERFGDGSLRIPESGNGVPDLLDEARFEVEFLLKMQVPEGDPLAGMAHHKIHDGAWTGLPYEPPTHASGRALHPPSTAATLNLAAVAAQAARIFRTYDPAFAERCLIAARRAWNAAQKNPDRFAPALDNQGGGPYNDAIVSDEFYWAAAELWLTTGEPRLREYFESSPHHKEFPTRLIHEDGSSDGDGVSGSFTWQSTAALGWISLALVPSELHVEEKGRLRSGIVSAADTYLEILEKEGYLLPLGLGESKKYPWGSNSFLINNLVVLSLAYDFKQEPKYAQGVVSGMDYLLGRNPLHQSYVSGYGSIPLQNPHHRFWAHSKNKKFPPPPPGAVSGGPNSSLQDPQTKRSGLSSDLPPQKCFVDHIDAWSVNEITINWNAPFAWVVAFLDDWRGAPPQTPPSLQPGPSNTEAAPAEREPEQAEPAPLAPDSAQPSSAAPESPSSAPAED